MSRQNGISVEDMLKLDILKTSKLVAGFRGIRNTISKVNIVADPDISEWLAEGEFLLTTAYSFNKDNPEAQKQLIQVCSNKKLAGMGIKVSPYLDSLPKEILDFADELNFPLIDVHQSVPLSDLLMVTFNEIFNKQASLLNRIEVVHEKLMNIMLEGKGIDEIAQVVQENVKNPVILNLDFNNQLYEHLGEDNVHIRDELLKEVEKFKEADNKKNKLKKLHETLVLINGKYVKRMIMPLMLRDNIYGHLFTWSTDMPLGGFDLAIIESASTTLSLCLLQELSVKEVEIRYRSEFFDDLVSIDMKRKKKALDRARYFNLKDENNYIVEVMSFKTYNGNMQDEEADNNYINDILKSIVIIIDELMGYYKLDGLVSTKVNGIQILISFADSNTKNNLKRVREFNEKLIEILADRYKDIEPKIGVGRIYKYLENVNKSFLDAVRTVRIGKCITNKEIVTYDELGIFKILSQDYLNDELEDFYNDVLKPLVDYDKKKSTELVKTLEVYFLKNGNLTKISKDLFAHYNTVLYRIGRINEITGMNLDNPHDRLNLEIALKIKELLGR